MIDDGIIAEARPRVNKSRRFPRGIAAVIVALRPELSGVIVPYAIYLAAHLAACALGSGVFAWLCARKRVLEQLQSKE